MRDYIIISVILVQLWSRLMFPAFFEIFNHHTIVQANSGSAAFYYMCLSLIPVCGLIVLAAGLIVGQHEPSSPSKALAICYLLMTAAFVVMGIDAAINLQENETLNFAFDLLNGSSTSHFPVGIFDLIMLFCVIIYAFPKFREAN